MKKDESPPSLEFKMLAALVLGDLQLVMEKQHSTGAFTALAMYLSRLYQLKTGVNVIEVSPEKQNDALEWSRELANSTVNIGKWQPFSQPSDDFIKAVQILSISLLKSIERGASFPFVATLLRMISWAYYLYTQNMIILDPSLNNSWDSDTTKLVEWAHALPLKLMVKGNVESI